MKLSAMKVDPVLTEQGDWVENITDLLGIRIKARGTNNSDCRSFEAKLVSQPTEDRRFSRKSTPVARTEINFPEMLPKSA